MTDKELQDFIKHGETGFVEFAMVFGDGWARHAIEIAKALRARLSQCERCGEVNPAEIHTCTPKREWQGLTENEIKHLWYEACQTNLELTSQLIVHLARNIEAKLKEKNT